jgi:hypothetical protein
MAEIDWSQYAAGGPPENVDVVSQGEAKLRQTGYLANGKPAPSAMVVDMNTPPPRGGPGPVDWSKYAATPPKQPEAVSQPDADKYDFTNDPEGAQQRLMGDLDPRGYARGAIRGATAPATIPADVAIWVTNKVRKVLDPEASTLDTDASDVLGTVMDKMGLKKPEGPGGTASELAGGLIGGGLNPKFAADINPGKWWSWANPTSPVNNSVLGDAVRQTLGVPSKPGEYGVTAEVMAAAQKAYKGALDIGRNAATIFQDNPRTIATSLASIAQDAGYEKDTLVELLKRPEVTKLFRIFQDGRATTEQLGNASSALGSAAASVSDSILRNTLFKFRDFAEDAIKSSLSPQAGALYEQGLQKFKAYQQISNSGALNTTTGEFNPVKFLNSIKNDADWINGSNQSPLYQVMRHVEAGQKVVDQMLDSVTGKIGYALRTAAKSIPGVAQSIVQRGIPETMRQIANHPGFLQSLGGNPDADANNVSNSPGQNP